MDSPIVFTPLDLEKFQRKIIRTRGCWEWAGGCFTSGYGSFRLADRRNLLAHRVAWMIVNGPIPQGKVVRHSCDNPRCVRPDHLLLGTHADNVKDKVDRGRQRGSRGEDHYLHKLTAEEVIDIRQRHQRGEQSYLLAQEYHVTSQTLCDVIKRRTWAHLDDGIPKPPAKHFAKLSDVQVDEIRRRYSAGKDTQQELANEFGIDQAQISRIVTRRAFS